MNTLQRIQRRTTSLAAVVMAVGLLAAAPLQAGEKKVTDERITGAIEDELLFDEAILLNNIDVETINGIATLGGKTDNILARERAAKIAETVRGVKAVVNNIEVKPRGNRTDSQLKNDVENALLIDPATESFEIMVEVTNGKAILTGTVDSWQERQLAEKIAQGVAGIRAVRNAIDVHYETERADMEIEPEIERRLKWDTLVDDGLIDVSVKDGAVTLSGIVGSAAEKRRAETDAWLAGVKSVDASDLKVERWARDDDLRKKKYVTKPDEEIEGAIEDAMLWDPRVNSFKVEASVDAGTATLRGKVDNLKAKRAASEDARNTVGVITVRNRIKVRPEGELTDAIIAEKVRKALRRDPIVEKFEVTVTVDNGIVDLYGQVDSQYEKGQADDLASRIAGVVAVDNNVTVDDNLFVYDPYVDDWYVYDYTWYDYEPGYTLLRTDAAIRDDIVDELWWSPFVDSDEVTVTVEDGVATLSGTVDSYTERSIAAENALEGGAITVNNRLHVQ